MKKVLFTVGAIMCLALVSVCLVSCGDDKEPDMEANYSASGDYDEEVTYFSQLASETGTRDTYNALRAELGTILSGSQWTVKYTKGNQDEVFKREDDAAKKKLTELENKVNAFKSKLEKLDKNDPKNQFYWSATLVMTCRRVSLSGEKIIETKTTTFKYDAYHPTSD
jgi:hypothetical protein